MTWRIQRRNFLQVLALGATQSLVGRHCRAGDVNSKLRVASIGTGNKGRDDLLQVAASPLAEIVAICDVDDSLNHLGGAAEKFPRAMRFADYRLLLDKPDAFDAVIVSTPDHMHAPIALAALELKKHVFCQKPLAHTVDEARKMRLASERNGLVTQMGNQIQSHRFYRTAVRMIHDGAIGKVREVHSWQSGAMGWLLVDARPADADQIPKSLHWDLWLGVAPQRPYNDRLYHPFNWRAWQDFSSGQLGDFGCHILDPVFLSLDLNAPISVQADAPPLNQEVWARQCTVKYEFPGNTRTLGDVLSVTWYDGAGCHPDRAALGLPDSYEMPGAGSVLVGESGTLVIPHVGEPRLFPEDKFRDYAMPVMEDVNHYSGWVDACLGNGTTTSHFGYAGPLTEAVLLGAVAVRLPQEKLLWDTSAAKFTNHSAANGYLTKAYRSGW
ncbi:MAG: Gfo/Idh/MocA family oxidoreductase [Planctomycetes bacterium]|nr:Gfo/Idh/MocA family oxidoreductase [Planctomycetota bacterium]